MTSHKINRSETYDKYCRVISTHKRSLFDELVQISDNIDFSHPRFMSKHKRNRSLGSAQAFIIELALTDDYFIDKLRKYMINEGKDYCPTISYIDTYR